MGTGSRDPSIVFWREDEKGEKEMKVHKVNLPSKEIEDAVKSGSPLIVTKYRDKETDKLKGQDGRVIWDGKDFIFISEKEKK